MQAESWIKSCNRLREEAELFRCHRREHRTAPRQRELQLSATMSEEEEKIYNLTPNVFSTRER